MDLPVIVAIVVILIAIPVLIRWVILPIYREQKASALYLAELRESNRIAEDKFFENMGIAARNNARIHATLKEMAKK